MDEPYTRVDGNGLCNICKLPWWEHNRETKYDSNDGQEIYFVRACDGSLLKT